MRLRVASRTVAAVILIAGCAGNRYPVVRREQIHTGMTIHEVYRLYAWEPADANTPIPPRFAIYPITETDDGQCQYSSYSYPLSHQGKKNPFLLTFKRCRLPNYEAVQEEKARRLEWLRTDPNLAEVRAAIQEFSTKNDVSEDQVAELLLFDKPEPLPRCQTDLTLVAIEPDTASMIQQQLTEQQKQLRRIRGQQMHYQQQQWMNQQQQTFYQQQQLMNQQMQMHTR